jgi:ABC-2 type transport system ATP-binding protein
MDGSTIIHIGKLTKWYRNSERPALDNIDLEIPSGRISGILGPNGAGKTTMIRILCGLLQPSSGEIFINGLSLRKELPGIKRLIGVVPQEIGLYPTLTATENLSVYGGICGLRGSDLKNRIDNWLVRLGLDKNRKQQVGRFSGGMKRRLNLIAGLIHDPQIIFLDEPTAGVDVHSKNVIIESLHEINRTGTTIVYTSHYLEEAEKLCSNVVIIDQGKIITGGLLEEIKRSYSTESRLEDIFLQLTGKELRD